MYPIETQFTESAKTALTLAQGEAESYHHSYIGTEHLLLGLLGAQDGRAAQVLRSLGVEINAARAVIDNVIGRSARTAIQQLIPTVRAQRVVEIAGAEARQAGATRVGTEHLLLGLLMEGEGLGAHVCTDLGANLTSVRRQVSR